MIAVPSSQVRSHFKEICDKVVNDVESVIITRTRGENVVLMSEDEYNNMMENFRIFSNPDIYNKIKSGIDQIENSKFSKRDLLDE
ncbi:type II toxin-antitoxin system Phd/YefM family antitoxin [Fusibacter paucivorans]|jgi:antitoxin YefM|uniref:Antitoxin n=1 Tax=Fusibacter paucivorans TaxID=76009 RepID=A0ABS5PUL6_9FIRM|nr:type II toxin-antitoxin system Phd/YefM family antitoxin [Fusibacter paucivorans]MBS7528853.1 type II toxin-antitoxin system Phd/YefM family antitoxin [Fusibacter paucivorans]